MWGECKQTFVLSKDPSMRLIAGGFSVLTRQTSCSPGTLRNENSCLMPRTFRQEHTNLQEMDSSLGSLFRAPHRIRVSDRTF